MAVRMKQLNGYHASRNIGTLFLDLSRFVLISDYRLRYDCLKVFCLVDLAVPFHMYISFYLALSLFSPLCSNSFILASLGYLNSKYLVILNPLHLRTLIQCHCILSYNLIL